MRQSDFDKNLPPIKNDFEKNYNPPKPTPKK